MILSETFGAIPEECYTHSGTQLRMIGPRGCAQPVALLDYSLREELSKGAEPYNSDSQGSRR